MLSLIHISGVISAKYVLIFPGYPNADDNPEDAWKRSVDSMNRLGNIAKTEGVTITFEATTPNITVVTNHKKIMQMIKDTGCENMAVTVDLMCLAQTQETVQDVYDCLLYTSRRCTVGAACGLRSAPPQRRPWRAATSL